MLEISKQLFKSWNNLQVSYCHWKSNEHLVPGLDGDTDLDVLLSDFDKTKGEAVLRSMEFIQCKSQFGSRYPGVDDWIGYDKSSGRFIHLHLHYKIVTGHKGLKEYCLPWTDDVLATKILDKETEVYIANPNIELLTIYTRIALKISLSDKSKLKKGTYKVDKSYLQEIKFLKERVSWQEVERLVSRYYGNSYANVLAIIQSEQMTAKQVSELRKIAERTFKNVNRYKSTYRLREFYYKYALKLCKLLRQKLNVFIVNRKVPKTSRGVQIAFLGQDGAGKTTVTTDIRKWWSWKMDVQYIYLGSGDNYFSWRKALQKTLPNSSGFKLIRAWLQFSKFKVLAKDVLTMIKAGEKFAAKGGLVIYDRYPQVEYPGISDGPKIRTNILSKLPRKLQPLFERYAVNEERYLKEATSHHPDIVFKLIIPPEESVRRKPENKLDTMKKKHELIKALQFPGSDVYIIDATMPYEEEILLIKNIIWEHIQK